MRFLLIVFATLLLLFSSSYAGEIEGEIVLSSNVPGRAKNSNPNRKTTLKKYGLKAVRNATSGGDGGLPANERVDERDFAVIYLSKEKDGAKLACTPRTVEIRQKQRRFIDHVTVAPLGSQVRFTNEDTFYHHIYCPDSSKLNVPEHRGVVTRKPSDLGKYELFCDIHPLMNAYIYVVPNDKYTVGKGGKFMLRGVPPGNYVLKAWHPRLSEKSYNVTVGAQKSTVKVSL